MYFTREDYKKIQDWLKVNSVKDTEFVPYEKFDGTELIAIVQDGLNKKMTFEQLVGVVNDMGLTHVPGIEDYEKFIKERVNATLLYDRPVVSESLNECLHIDEMDLLATVRYVIQELSDKQQERARKNISAASQQDLDKAIEDRDKADLELQREIDSINLTNIPRLGDLAILNEDIRPEEGPEYFAVYAVNKLDDKANATDLKIGNLNNLSTEAKNHLVGAINEIITIIGKLDNLTTTSKASVVVALNSLKTEIGAALDLKTDMKIIVPAINELYDAIMLEIENDIDMETEIFN